MAVVTSYPGVYLSEESVLNFSVSGSNTAIPAFIFTKADESTLTEKTYRFSSWLDVKNTLPDERWNKKYFNALYQWFSNGGGVCYLVESVSVAEINTLDDVTLIVSNGCNDYLTGKVDSLTGPGKCRFVLLDGPDFAITSGHAPADIMKLYPSTPYAGVWYPWVTTAKATITVPPSVIAAITIAKTDSTRGVWKAPANVVLNGITPEHPVSDDLQGRFTQGKALNMIRDFPDMGTVAWGGRTLEDSDSWRYISVRRLFSMVEKDVQKALNNVVFEPNTQITWQKVKVAIENYLYRLWQQGALLGNQAEEAFYVSIGKDITMTDEDIKQGKMILSVGLAAVRPAEFIILQFSQDIA